MLRTVLPFVGVLLAAAQAIAKCRPVMPQPGKNWSKHNAAHVTTDKAHHVAAGRVPLSRRSLQCRQRRQFPCMRS